MSFFVLTDILFQALSAAASVGRVYTTNRVVGRRWNMAALFCVGFDYGLHYLHDHKSIQFTGALVFGTLTARTGTILALRLDGPGRARRAGRSLISGVAWLACAIIVTWNEYRTSGFSPRMIATLQDLVAGSSNVAALWYLAKHVFDPSVVALAGMGLGCLGESMGDMTRTRRCILGMGLLMTGFGAATHNWGQLFKNVVADVSATVISAIEYQDRPLPTWFPRQAAAMSAAVRRFRARWLTVALERPAKTPAT